MKRTTKMLILIMSASIPFMNTIYANDSEGNVLISRNAASVTTSDVDNYLSTLPEDQLAQFIVSRKRVLEVIANLLDTKSLYTIALDQGVENKPDVQQQLARARMQIIIQAWLNDYVDSNMLDDYSQLAKEHYLVNRGDYIEPESVTVRHVLISTRGKTPEQAGTEAAKIRQRILDGDLTFKDALIQYSDDPSKAKNNGQLENVGKGQTHPAFEQAAFALTERGEISDIVVTAFGSHIIQLLHHNDPRQLEFDEVKDKIVDLVKTQHRQQLSKDYIDRIKETDVNLNEDALTHYLENMSTR
jgi:peptidyl-prolyl cis-trans isomerase C